MPDSIHGHEVLHMMLADPARDWTDDGLIRAIEARFGPAARFHTCSAENLTAAGLVEFLAARGKFRPSGPAAGFTADAARMCRD